MFDSSSAVAIVEIRILQAKARAVTGTDARTNETVHTLEHYVAGVATVHETLKGKLGKSIQVETLTPANSCFIPAYIGQKYLVFLGKDKVIRFYMCGSDLATPLNLVPEDIIAKWRAK